MKKQYYKPEIIFEDFSLSTNIAGDCEMEVDTQARGNCAIVGTGGISVFTATLDACGFTPTQVPGQDDDDKYNGFCYHVPVETANIFNS